MIEIRTKNTFLPQMDRKLTIYPIGSGYSQERFILPSTIELLNARQQNYINVGMGNYAYSSSCQATFAQLYCDSIILRSLNVPNYRGLGHIISNDNPAELVDQLISKFPFMAPLEAMLIRTEGNRDTRLIDLCSAAGIEIVHFVESPIRSVVEKHDYSALFKDVLVTPTRGEVILNIEEMGTQYFEF